MEMEAGYIWGKRKLKERSGRWIEGKVEKKKNTKKKEKAEIILRVYALSHSSLTGVHIRDKQW